MRFSKSRCAPCPNSIIGFTSDSRRVRRASPGSIECRENAATCNGREPGKPYNSDMKLKFTKMQGAGNDFVVIDGIERPFTLDAAQIRHLADRHFGVGADQLLVVEKPTIEGVDFRYRIFNAEGGHVDHCAKRAP